MHPRKVLWHCFRVDFLVYSHFGFRIFLQKSKYIKFFVLTFTGFQNFCVSKSEILCPEKRISLKGMCYTYGKIMQCSDKQVYVFCQDLFIDQSIWSFEAQNFPQHVSKMLTQRHFCAIFWGPFSQMSDDTDDQFDHALELSTQSLSNLCILLNINFSTELHLKIIYIFWTFYNQPLSLEVFWTKLSSCLIFHLHVVFNYRILVRFITEIVWSNFNFSQRKKSLRKTQHSTLFEAINLKIHKSNL